MHESQGVLMTTGPADFYPEQPPGADPALLSSGSLVFFPTGGPVNLRDARSTAHLGFRCVVREQGQLAAGERQAAYVNGGWSP
jgi:hypothetical protein